MHSEPGQPERRHTDVNLIVSNIKDLFSFVTQIRRIQAATVDLLKAKGYFTSAEFETAHENVVALGLKDVGTREKALKALLQDDGAALPEMSNQNS